jgi:hypothetical protein
MHSDKNRIWCEECGKAYTMDEYGRLAAENGKTEFSHIPDWYEWERQQVKEQIQSGKYRTELEVNIDSLPNSTGYYRLGKGVLIHDLNGFSLTGDFNDKNGNIFKIKKAVLENYGVHVEYDYFGKGDGVSFSTNCDTYYMYPTKQRDIVTKIHFATEELYKIKKAEIEQDKQK